MTLTNIDLMPTDKNFNWHNTTHFYDDCLDSITMYDTMVYVSREYEMNGLSKRQSESQSILRFKQIYAIDSLKMGSFGLIFCYRRTIIALAIIFAIGIVAIIATTATAATIVTTAITLTTATTATTATIATIAPITTKAIVAVAVLYSY
uniref:Uncharacterized protein n=1 Tax=Glossina brevipalpis TaxID=37001 RepID=A0A1A9WWN0_9MUSC